MVKIARGYLPRNNGKTLQVERILLFLNRKGKNRIHYAQQMP
jgi:hypothetical protein